MDPNLAEGLADLPIIGPLIFGHDALVYLSWIVVAVSSYYLFRTRPGLTVRAVGEDPASAEAAGVNVAMLDIIGAQETIRDVYHLDRPVILSCDGVVIRGQGVDTTKLVFRYGGPEGGVGFFQPADDDVVGPYTPLEAHAKPDGLRRIAILAAGQVLTERAYHAHWGGTFMIRTFGIALRRLPPGYIQLTAIAEWEGGRRAESKITVRWVASRARFLASATALD